MAFDSGSLMAMRRALRAAPSRHLGCGCPELWLSDVCRTRVRHVSDACRTRMSDEAGVGYFFENFQGRDFGADHGFGADQKGLLKGVLAG
jgi:hypothetical protein